MLETQPALALTSSAAGCCRGGNHWPSGSCGGGFRLGFSGLPFAGTRGAHVGFGWGEGGNIRKGSNVSTQSRIRSAIDCTAHNERSVSQSAMRARMGCSLAEVRTSMGTCQGYLTCLLRGCTYLLSLFPVVLRPPLPR